MRVFLVQSNPTVGALDANARDIRDGIREAAAQGAQVALFPELALTGYPPRDLVLNPGFVRENLALVRELARATTDTAAVIGYVDQGPDGALYNAAAVARNGVIEHVARKMLLPTYDVFDEHRYFRPGDDPLLFSVGGRAAGLLICEDVWNDDEFWGRSLYVREPVAELARRGMDVLLTISASPFSTGRIPMRVEMMRAHARRHRRPMVYLNQLGGNDQLLFDGSSFVVAADGRLLATLSPFTAERRLVDLDAPGEAAFPAESDAEWARQALVLGLRDYVQKCGFKHVVLGLSGGVDSAVVAALASEALGSDAVTTVFMPSRYTSGESREDARALASNLGTEYIELPIDPLFESFLGTLQAPFAGTQPGVAEENIQARVRGNLLMALSNKFGWLVLSTGNKSEMAVGYCTLYGDMSGGLSVISDLPKTMVYEVGRLQSDRMGKAITERIFTRAPTAELREDQKDEDSLPPYGVLDQVLKYYIEEGRSADAIVARGLDRELVERVIGMVDRNEYKRQQAAPGLRVTSKAFGVGRRMPIAQRYVQRT